MARVIASSSASDASRICRARFTLPAPRTRHGLAGITSSASAVFMIVRSRL